VITAIVFVNSVAVGLILHSIIIGYFPTRTVLMFVVAIISLFLGYNLRDAEEHDINETSIVIDLKNQLLASSEEINQLKQTNPALPNSINSDISIELLEGKAKTTALQLIGGLVMSAYGMDIHANRLENLSQVVNDLEVQGITITKETVSKWIKEAAKEIDQPKSK
jgi:hypothetical protein